MRHEHETSLHRIETFADGVFAIAITLLIIEIGVPHITGDQTLGNELWRQWPKYGTYVLSFVMIGIYWANHNSFFRLFARSDHVFLMLNVGFLMAIAFLPFPTAVLGDYLRNSGEWQTAVLFYALGLVLPATTWLTVALRHRKRSAAHGPSSALRTPADVAIRRLESDLLDRDADGVGQLVGVPRDRRRSDAALPPAAATAAVRRRRQLAATQGLTPSPHRPS